MLFISSLVIRWEGVILWQNPPIFVFAWHIQSSKIDSVQICEQAIVEWKQTLIVTGN